MSRCRWSAVKRLTERPRLPPSTASRPLGTVYSNCRNVYIHGDRRTLTAATSTSVTITAPVVVPAARSALDPTFAADGLASHDVGFTSTAGVVVQSDGKSVIAGTAGVAGSESFGITRYNADGSLDTTFGDNGVSNASFGGDDVADAEVLLSNGDILIAGTSTTFVNGAAAGSQFALAEFTPAGALDTTFGNGTGEALTSFSSTAGVLSNDVAHALAVGPDGTIYVGGSSDTAGHGQDFAIAAYNSGGGLSTAFGGTGKVLLDFLGGNDSIAARRLEPRAN